MIRVPNEAELTLINAQAKKPLTAGDVYVVDAVMANDFMTTCYYYNIGTSSLLNFQKDLQAERLRLGASHERDLNFGRWLPGEIVSVDTPSNALKGKSYQLEAPFYMPKGLTVGKYNTDELAKAIEAGIIADVSIEWEGEQDLRLACNICGNDIRDYEKCEHYPGKEYDGKLCTFSLENAHLSACDLVDDGGLPGASLSSGSEFLFAGRSDLFANEIKNLSKEGGMNGSLRFSLADKGGLTVKWEDAKKQFEKELIEEYVLKADHENTLAKTLSENEQAKGDLEKLQGEHTALTEKFADINDEINSIKSLSDVGKAHLEYLTKEYHRLGVALNDDKWVEEVENNLISGLADDMKRAEYLASKIELMSGSLKERLEKKQEQKTDNKEYTHLDDPDLYRIG